MTQQHGRLPVQCPNALSLVQVYFVTPRYTLQFDYSSFEADSAWLMWKKTGS
ncbi:MAG: hypothetical protein AAB259_02860 [Pseudomonadota bacterium]